MCGVDKDVSPSDGKCSAAAHSAAPSPRADDETRERRRARASRMSLAVARRATRAIAREMSRASRAMTHATASASRGARDGSWTPDANAARFGTSDICDVHHPGVVDDVIGTSASRVRVARANALKDYGGTRRFRGEVSTVLCFENNPLVRLALEEPGLGRVLVVDGGGSERCALLGDNLAETAARNGWSGVIVNGCVRDSEDIAKFNVGVKAIGTHPLKSSKRDPGLRDVPVTFAGVTFVPGSYVYADADGIVVSPEKLEI